MKLYWSNEGTEDAEWKEIEDIEETQEDTSEGTPNTTKVNYRFDGVPAVAFKIVLTSDPGTNDEGKNLAVGLTEVELREEESSLEKHSEAILDNILLNGDSVSQSELEDKVINTDYQEADVETESDKNVAVTVLEPYENVIRIMTESEDHSTRENYTINLAESAPITDVSDLQGLVEQYEESGDLSSDESIRALKVHLESLVQFEKSGDDKKVVKHLKGLKDLLDHQKAEEEISAEAYESLMNGTDTLVKEIK